MTSEPLTPEALDTIEARANAATEGPWRVDPKDRRADIRCMPGVGYDHRGQAVVTAADGSFGAAEVHDAEFISSAREDVPRLVAEVRRLRCDTVEAEALEAVSNLHPAWHDQGAGIVQGSHYRSGFAAGAVWRAVQDDVELRRLRTENEKVRSLAEEPCVRYIGGYTCASPRTGRTPDARYSTERYCYPCRLHAALTGEATE